MISDKQLSDCISGVSTSRLSSSANLLSDDEFLISEPCLDVDRPAHWYSKKLSFAQLSAKLMADISAVWKFGSMAWEDRDDYARWDHSHSCYNKVTGVSCAYEDDLSGTVDLGTLAVDSRVYHLRMPAPVIQTADQPVAGQLRFMTTQLSTAETVDWTSDAFDGWVYPDGSAFPLSAFDVDGEFEVSGDFFLVPVLSDFIRLNPVPYVSVDVGQDYSDFVPPHSHTVDITLSGQATGHLRYAVSTAAGAGGGCRGSSYKNRMNPYSLGLDCSGLRIQDSGYVLSSDEVGTESAPSYVWVRTMIYIGKPVS